MFTNHITENSEQRPEIFKIILIPHLIFFLSILEVALLYENMLLILLIEWDLPSERKLSAIIINAAD